MAEHMNLGQRFAYHPPITDGVRIAHETVRSNCRSLASIFERELPSGREKSLAVTKIEEAMFWANAAIARHQNEGQEDGAVSRADGDYTSSAPGPCHGEHCRHVSHQDTAAPDPCGCRACRDVFGEKDDAEPAHCEGCGNDDGPSWCEGIGAGTLHRARAAYEAHREAMNSFAAPLWERLDSRSQAAWKAAAAAAVRA